MHGYLRHLANFAHAVDAGAITSAANRLDVSPSVISDSVKIIETYFGEPLLERRKTGVVPTGRGEEVFEHAQAIVDALGNALLPSNPSRPSGTLRISLPEELAHGWYARALAQILEIHPEITIVMMVEDEVMDHTKFARDLYIRVGPSAEHSDLQVLHKEKISAVLVGHPDLAQNINADDPKAVEDLRLICAPHRKPPRMLRLKNDAPSHLNFDNLLQLDAIAPRIAMAREGLGLVACLEPTVRADLKAGTLVQFCPDSFAFQTTLTIGSPHQRPPPKARVVAEILAQTGLPA